MREKGFTGVFLAALLLAGVATLGVYRVIDQRSVAARGNSVTTIPVVVATVEIAEGTRVTPVALRVAEFTSEAVPAGSFSDVDSVVGRVARIPIFSGEPVLESKLAPEGATGGLEVKIQPGFRAMAIPVNETVGISGLIQPNSRVDVIVTLQPDRSGREKIAKLFLQNMRVLSVGQQIRRGEDGKPIAANTVTLEVSPEEGEMLAVAMNQGVLQLALRGFGDPDSTLTTGASPSKVLASARRQEGRPVRRPTPRAPTPAPVVEGPATRRVQIIRGTELTEKEVDVQEEDSVIAKRNGSDR